MWEDFDEAEDIEPLNSHESSLPMEEAYSLPVEAAALLPLEAISPHPAEVAYPLPSGNGLATYHPQRINHTLHEEDVTASIEIVVM